jgi:hypothetical protein
VTKPTAARALWTLVPENEPINDHSPFADYRASRARSKALLSQGARRRKRSSSLLTVIGTSAFLQLRDLSLVGWPIYPEMVRGIQII